MSRLPGDNRQNFNNDARRVEFGLGRIRISNQFHGGKKSNFRRNGPGGDAPRNVDMDGDVLMGETSNESHNRRFNPYVVQQRKGFKSGRPQRGGGGGGRRGPNTSSRDGLDGFNHRANSWSKIILPLAKRVNIDILFDILGSKLPVPLVPFNFHYDGQTAIFYIKDTPAAITLKKLNGALTTNDGFKIKIVVRLDDKPQILMTDETHRVLKEAIMRRYNPHTSALDLHAFHQDPTLNNAGYVLYFKTNNIMTAISKAINDSLPQVLALDLSGNELTQLDYFSRQNDKMSRLKVLILNDNKISSVKDLTIVSKYPLEELSLIGNYVSRVKDRSQLVETLRQRFPHLTKLDGQSLPPQIGFDVEKPVELPPSKDSFFVNDQGKHIAVNFFERYFSLYDTARSEVCDAYHTDAVFSLVITRGDSRTPGSSLYLQNSRNLHRVSDREKREKLLFQGKYNIMAFLSKIPRTQHDPASICLDVISCSDLSTSVFISGIFKEVDTHKSDIIRSFNRSFILVPMDGGFKIINDMLLIMVPTNQQRSQAFKNPEVASQIPNPVPSTSLAMENDIEMKRQMVISFSQQSGMTREWSERCLADLQWNFEKAAQAFANMNAAGGIPREAFVQMENA